eukprot:CAMPEP_0197604888 /NCGR_PEP_ID=MMETSP1326-20131121/42070_1 /TAXON_ID=1155430 /ORGANISM="Genus nov. species nov., Strain RCC2288" /LENGTH=50 /DNA_ID=CAMNT_0043172615 /DNA_START=42 /DNA_END=191 /DNA_ORIENTATION=-
MSMSYRSNKASELASKLVRSDVGGVPSDRSGRRPRGEEIEDVQTAPTQAT